VNKLVNALELALGTQRIVLLKHDQAKQNGSYYQYSQIMEHRSKDCRFKMLSHLPISMDHQLDYANGIHAIYMDTAKKKKVQEECLY
jgi:hypothetical protein